jgi:hypothetical protein
MLLETAVIFVIVGSFLTTMCCLNLRHPRNLIYAADDLILQTAPLSLYTV